MLKHKPRTANQLYMYFTKRYPNMPIHLVQDNIKAIIERRQARGEARRDKSRLRKTWQAILTPLQTHIQSVLTNQALHEQSNPEYFKFNQRYLTLLRTLRDNMKEHIKKGYYPKDSLAHSGIHKATIEGVTWTWWVEDSIKQKVLTRYAQLPRTNKTNYRELFPEPKADTMPKVRQKLKDTIMTELTDVELQIGSPHLSDTGKQYYGQMKDLLNQALTRLENLPRKAKTPKIYDSLFTKDERHELFPMIYPQQTDEGEPQ